MREELQEYCISTSSSVADALKKLDRMPVKCLYVCEGDYLRATITDGDIRRFFLNGGKIEGKILSAANCKPHFVSEENRCDAVELSDSLLLNSVAIVSNDGKLVDLFFPKEIKVRPKTQIDVPIVMMAGGKGTRLYPYTKILPKPLVPVAGTPMAERIIDSFAAWGCNDFTLIVNHKKEMIKEYFNNNPKPYVVTFVDEDVQLGTGGGLKLAEKLIDRTFILTNCDILIEANIADIFRMHRESGNMVTMVCSLKNFTIPYGVVDMGTSGELLGMREKPELPFFTNTGVYFVEPEVLELIGINETVGFPDVVMRCKEKGWNVGIYPISESSWIDMGQVEEMQHAEEKFK